MFLKRKEIMKKWKPILKNSVAGQKLTKNIETKKVLDPKISVHQFTVSNSYNGTSIRLERSTISTLTHRKYIKLLDGFSYVGGLFPTLFALFFFMDAFNIYFC